MHRLQQKVDDDKENNRIKIDTVVEEKKEDQNKLSKSVNEFTLNDGELESYCDNHCNVTTLSHSASGKSNDKNDFNKDTSNPLKLDLSCILNERNDNSILYDVDGNKDKETQQKIERNK
jgi:hypothetical protein